MKILLKLLFLFAITALLGCNQEESTKIPPASASVVAPTSAATPAILNPAIETLHKAEGLNQVVSDESEAQHEKIEKSTQE